MWKTAEALFPLIGKSTTRLRGCVDLRKVEFGTLWCSLALVFHVLHSFQAC